MTKENVNTFQGLEIDMDKTTETIKRRYNRNAGIYDRIEAMMEKGKMAELVNPRKKPSP